MTRDRVLVQPIQIRAVTGEFEHVYSEQFGPALEAADGGSRSGVPVHIAP